MHAVEQAFGPENVISRNLISSQVTPSLMRDGVTRRSVVDFEWLFDGIG